MHLATGVPTIIVSYGNPPDVVACLEALRGLSADPAFDVYICENAGAGAFDALYAALTAADGPCTADNSAPRFAALMPSFVQVRPLLLHGRDARVWVAEATENFGYAGAINAWLRVLLTLDGWPGVWILNPDTQPDTGALAELVAWSSSRKKGMVGSQIVVPSAPDVVHTRGLKWHPIRASTLAVDRSASSAIEPDPDELEARLDAPSGASIYVSRSCLDRLGLMAEDYFLYFEDADWGYRAKRCCGVGHAHKSIVLHYGGTTTGYAANRFTASPFSVYLDFRNRVHFVRRNHPSWLAWTLLVLVARALEYGVSGAFGNMHAALFGLKAALAGETGRPDRLFEFGRGTPRLRKRPVAIRRSLSGQDV